jgi:hypothetical protein
MAAFPFRRRKAAGILGKLAIAEAALAMVKSRVAAKAGRRRSGPPVGKLLAAGGAVAAGVAAFLGRRKVADRLPWGSHDDTTSAPAAPPPPQPSNYDAPGPVANTATPIPAPDPHGEPPAHVDEAAEEAAAAAEAGAIGGEPSDYAGPELGEPAGEAERPLAEAGQGEAEGQEQAEAELAANAEYRDAGASDTERQIEEAIDDAARPQSGETPEPVVSEPGQEPGERPSGEPSGESSGESSGEGFLPPTGGGGISGRPNAGLDLASDGSEETPGQPGSPDAENASGGAREGGSGGDDDNPGDYRTWSGRSVDS